MKEDPVIINTVKKKLLFIAFGCDPVPVLIRILFTWRVGNVSLYNRMQHVTYDTLQRKTVKQYIWPFNGFIML